MANDSISVIKNGYDLPFVGNDSNVTLYIGILNVVLMLTSCIVGIVTVVLSFKGSRHKHFLKWRNVDRFIVYKAVNDIIYYLIQICYLVHITVQQANYPDPVSCTTYAVLTNVFGLSQALTTFVVSVVAFTLVYCNEQLTLGPGDLFLYVIALITPVPIFSILGALGKLGPNGFYCNFDGVMGWLAHVIIVSVGYTLLILATGILYIFICLKIYKQTKKLEVATRKEFLAKKRTLSIARHSSLLILSFLVQFGVFIVEGIWNAVETPPSWIRYIIVTIASCGGIVNGIVFYTIRKQKRTVLPKETKETRQDNSTLSTS